MVAVGQQDYYREVAVAEDDNLGPADSAGTPVSETAGDATEAATDALVAPGADTGNGEDRSGLQEFHRRLHALSPDRPLRPPVPSTVASAALPPAITNTT